MESEKTVSIRQNMSEESFEIQLKDNLLAAKEAPTLLPTVTDVNALFIATGKPRFYTARTQFAGRGQVLETGFKTH